MYRYIIFLFFIFTCTCTFGGNLFSLKGKTIVIPDIQMDGYYDKNYVPCVYTDEVLRKFKFKDDFLYDQNVFGDTISVKDIVIRNKGKKNEEALILAIHKGRNVIIHIPFKFKYEKRPYSSRWINKLSQETGWSSVNLHGQADDIEIPYIDIAQLDSLRFQYNETTVSPIKSSRLLIYDDENDFIRNGKGKAVLLGRTYSFIGTKLMDDERWGLYFWQDGKYKNYPYVSCIFKDDRDSLIYFPIRVPSLEFDKVASSRGPLEKMPSVHTFSQFFISSDSLRNLSIAHYDNVSVELALNKFIDKEIHFSYPNTSYLSFSNEPTLTLSRSNIVIATGQKPSEYGVLSEILMLPSMNHLPYMWPYAVVGETTNSITRVAVPIDSTSIKLFSLASDYRDLLRNEAEERMVRDRERKLAEEQEERDYFNSLVRRFGRSNTRLILDGSIKIGFTKEMVRESWGEPYDINRTITRNVTIEQWVYGLGTYVYFEGNIVTGIQD